VRLAEAGFENTWRDRDGPLRAEIRSWSGNCPQRGGHARRSEAASGERERYVSAIHASGGWKLLQFLRGLSAGVVRMGLRRRIPSGSRGRTELKRRLASEARLSAIVRLLPLDRLMLSRKMGRRRMLFLRMPGLFEDLEESTALRFPDVGTELALVWASRLPEES